MKSLIALLLLCSPAVAQTPLDISIAIAIAEAEAAQQPAVARSAAKPAKLDVRSGAPAKSTPVVVKQPGPMWKQNGHTATVEHLVNVHGIDRSLAERMTPAQRDIAHSNAHNAGRYSTSGCPGGRCPAPSRGFRLFRR
jgi:hypothetical protein